MSLRDQLDINAETWRPNDTDKSPANTSHPKDICGTILELDVYDTEYGQAPAITIAGDDGNYWRWVVIGEVAQKRIDHLQVKIGDAIAIRYLGRKPSPTRPGVSYHDWKIVHEPGNGAAAAEKAVQQALALAEEPF